MNNDNLGNEKGNSFNRNFMSEGDKLDLELLNIQIIGALLFIYSDILTLVGTLQGIQLINDKYNGEPRGGIIPDAIALQSTYLAFIARLIFANISFTRFNFLSNEANKGELEFSLEPDVNINIGNIISIVAYTYFIKGAEGFYQRDIAQPTFGFR